MSANYRKYSDLLKLYETFKAKIPDINRGHSSFDARLEQQLRLDDKGNPADYEERAKFVEEQLLCSGIQPVLVEFIMDKFVSNLSYQDIATKYGYNNRNQVRNIYTRIINVLRSNKALKLTLKHPTLKRGNF